MVAGESLRVRMYAVEEVRSASNAIQRKAVLCTNIIGRRPPVGRSKKALQRHLAGVAKGRLRPFCIAQRG